MLKIAYKNTEMGFKNCSDGLIVFGDFIKEECSDTRYTIQPTTIKFSDNLELIRRNRFDLKISIKNTNRIIEIKFEILSNHSIYKDRLDHEIFKLDDLYFSLKEKIIEVKPCTKYRTILS